jgi:hypothetical protein
MQYKLNTEARSRNYCCRGKAVSVTYSDCVSVFVAFFIEHALCTPRVILSPAASLALLYVYFSTSSHLLYGSPRKKNLHIKCVFFPYSFHLKHFSF